MRQMLSLLFTLACLPALFAWSPPPEDKTKCPKVKALRNFDLHQMVGFWYVVEYYASSEEAPEYSCMRAELSVTNDHPGVFMNFTYSFADDPEHETLMGNITWIFPEKSQLAHWVHSEDTYEGVYNTFVLDWDKTFGLLLHCAEMTGTTRYLSSLVLSRNVSLPNNVITYLREKLPKYDIDLAYMFPMSQENCQQSPLKMKNPKKKRKHAMKRRSKAQQEIIASTISP